MPTAHRKDQSRVDAKGAGSGTCRRAASALRGTSEGLRDVGPLPDLADQAAEQIEKLANYVQSKNLGDLVREVERFARREPAIFLGASFAVGLLGGRFMKASASPAEPVSTGRSRRQQRSRGRDIEVRPAKQGACVGGDVEETPTMICRERASSKQQNGRASWQQPCNLRQRERQNRRATASSSARTGSCSGKRSSPKVETIARPNAGALGSSRWAWGGHGGGFALVAAAIAAMALVRPLGGLSSPAALTGPVDGGGSRCGRAEAPRPVAAPHNRNVKRIEWLKEQSRDDFKWHVSVSSLVTMAKETTRDDRTTIGAEGNIGSHAERFAHVNEIEQRSARRTSKSQSPA